MLSVNQSSAACETCYCGVDVLPSIISRHPLHHEPLPLKKPHFLHQPNITVTSNKGDKRPEKQGNSAENAYNYA